MGLWLQRVLIYGGRAARASEAYARQQTACMAAGSRKQEAGRRKQEVVNMHGHGVVVGSLHLEL